VILNRLKNRDKQIDMTELIKDDEYLKYYIDNELIEDYRWEFEVYEVSSWDMEPVKPCDTELFFKASIKWDGCSHVWIEDGYMHICGGDNWRIISEVFDKVWKLAPEKIKNFDKDIADYE